MNTLTFRNGIAYALSMLLITACSRNKDAADAYGNFEAVETLVSAKASGELMDFRIEEGMTLAAGTQVGWIDTIPVALQLQEAEADRAATASRTQNIQAQVALQDARLADLRREEARLQKLVAGNAAPPKQLDDIRGQIAIAERQYATFTTQNPAIAGQVAAGDARIARSREMLADHRIINPVKGTVLTKLAEVHELAAPGRALYRIAQLDTMELRAYIAGDRLPTLTLGAAVEVGIDQADGSIAKLPGRVSWVSSQAEFTPKTVQTREERVDMVYAFKVRVANDGRLKIGMPAEVHLTAPGT